MRAISLHESEPGEWGELFTEIARGAQFSLAQKRRGSRVELKGDLLGLALTLTMRLVVKGGRVSRSSKSWGYLVQFVSHELRALIERGKQKKMDRIPT